MTNRFAAFLCTLAFLASISSAQAHPVPREAHDRGIIIHLTPEAVLVEYHIDTDIEEWTLFKDLGAVYKEVELADLKKPSLRRAAFLKAYAPILARNLDARFGKEELKFTCVKTSHLSDRDHIRFSFVFEAPWKPRLGEPGRFTFADENYKEFDSGRVDLSLVGDDFVTITEKVQPDEALKKRPQTELKPGDSEKLRTASATFVVDLEPLPMPKRESTGSPSPAPSPTPPPAVSTAPPAAEEKAEPRRLIDLLFNSEMGFWAMMGLAAVLGAAHALTPGHGKTLVAAYLVGERGTVWHAVFLGVVTTLTHTGSVLLVAVGLAIFFPKAAPVDLEVVLKFLGGLVIAALGFWLFLRRLSGGPDHFHIGGGHHHHHHHGHDHAHHHHHDHGDADHYHDEHGHTHPVPKASQGWWGLVALGFGGGIVPCWDAIVMLIWAIGAQMLWAAVPLLLAFSAGLAGVLVAIGVFVVKVKGFAGSHIGESRFFKLLPIVSAALVTILGLWMCYDSMHPEPTPPARVARAS